MNATHNIALRFFLTASTEEVLHTFSGLPHAVRGDGFVYVPGNRDYLKRVLLVGHADTVRPKDLKLKYLKCVNNTFSAMDGPLGADDRAGLAMLWILNAEGSAHSMLVTDGEESGGTGAREAVESITGELFQHSFCVEVDRRGSEELVFYDGCANTAFKLWLKEQFPGWTQGLGSYTDIATVCPGTLLCGMNLAAGFRREHTHSEKLVYADWLKTLKALQGLLALEEYPKFGMPDEKEERPVFGMCNYKWLDDITGDWRDWNGQSDPSRSVAIPWRYGYQWEKETEDENNSEPFVPTGKLARLDVQDDIQWLPVLNEAGDVVDYVDPCTLLGDVLEVALKEGYIAQWELTGEGEEIVVD